MITFRGGVHPNDGKEYTKDKQIEKLEAIQEVVSYYRTRSYSSNNSSFLFYLEVISYHWREVNHYNLRHP